MRPPYNLLSFGWEAKKNGSLDELEQRFVVISPVQTAVAEWRSKDNRTRITSVVGGQQQRTTVPGMFLLRLATNNGALSIETTP